MTWRAVLFSRPCHLGTSYWNCTACSSGSGECGACESGFTLEKQYPSLYWPGPGAGSRGLHSSTIQLNLKLNNYSPAKC
jgi:hypothetical protein